MQAPNKIQLIGYLAIIVIVVSLANIGVKFTGFATANDTAVVNVTIISSAAINFTTDFINFGAGAVNAGSPNATLNTEGVVTGGNWTATTTNFTLVNIGSVNVSLALLSDKDAATFIGGSTPKFQFKILNNTEPDSCRVNNVSETYTDFTTTALTVCSVFPYEDAKDMVTIPIQLVIPYDSLNGVVAKTATITAVGTYA